jgi:hypothetical protein
MRSHVSIRRFKMEILDDRVEGAYIYSQCKHTGEMEQHSIKLDVKRAVDFCEELRARDPSVRYEVHIVLLSEDE